MSDVPPETAAFHLEAMLDACVTCADKLPEEVLAPLLLVLNDAGLARGRVIVLPERRSEYSKAVLRALGHG